MTERIEYGTLQGMSNRNSKKDKALIFHERALREIKRYSKDVRGEIGYLLHKLQQGETLTMPKSKPISTIVKGADELRVKMEDGWFRVFYYMKHKDGILVFHSFKKKTNTTSQSDKDTGSKRYKELVKELNNEKS